MGAVQRPVPGGRLAAFRQGSEEMVGTGDLAALPLPRTCLGLLPPQPGARNGGTGGHPPRWPSGPAECDWLLRPRRRCRRSHDAARGSSPSRGFPATWPLVASLSSGGAG
jgi:hypothetical protein